MAYTTIDDPTAFFQAVTYTGNGATGRSIVLPSDTDMQPDWVWVKSRGEAEHHQLTDSVRGVNKQLYSHLTYAEATETDRITAFNSDGFTIQDDIIVNKNSIEFVAWCWKAGGSASSNSNGSITSTVSASATSGFSIVSWTGSGASATIGHGISSAPELVIVKNRSDSSTDWRIGNTVVSGKTMSDGNGYYLEFDTGAIANPGSKTIWGSGPSAPTSTVFSVGSNNSNNGSSDNMIAYCFSSIKGYSKIGSYTGNGNADGTFVYTGFRPAWLLIKKTSDSQDWVIIDTKRDSINLTFRRLEANNSDAEVNGTSYNNMDLLSNGFKFRADGGNTNANSGVYVYMAFAEAPFVNSKGVPTNAR